MLTEIAVNYSLLCFPTTTLNSKNYKNIPNSKLECMKFLEH